MGLFKQEDTLVDVVKRIEARVTEIEKTLKEKTYCRYKNELSYLEGEYKQCLAEGILYLRQAQKLSFRLADYKNLPINEKELSDVINNIKGLIK